MKDIIFHGFSRNEHLVPFLRTFLKKGNGTDPFFRSKKAFLKIVDNFEEKPAFCFFSNQKKQQIHFFIRSKIE
jgi:hypothetical protein